MSAPIGALLFAAIPVLANYQGTLLLSDHSEVRVRDSGVTGDPVALDLMTTPVGRLTLSSPRNVLSLSYSPRFAMRDAMLLGSRSAGCTDSCGVFNFNPELLQSLSLSDTTRSRFASLTLSEDATFGRQNFVGVPLGSVGVIPSSGTSADAVAPPAGAPPTSPANLNLVNENRTISFGSSRTTLSTALFPVQRWILTSSLSYQISGGLYEDAQTSIPLQQGPRFDVGWGYSITKKDRFFTLGAISKTDFSQPIPPPPSSTGPPTIPLDGRQIVLIEGSEQWVHRWNRRTESQLAVGATQVRQRPTPHDAYDRHTVLTASGGVTQQLQSLYGGRNDLRMVARWAPTIDRLTGEVNRRIDISATSTWTRRRTTLVGVFGFATSLETTVASPTRVFYVQGRYEYQFTPQMGMDAGVRLAKDVEGGVNGGPTPGLQKVIFAGITLSERPFRF